MILRVGDFFKLRFELIIKYPGSPFQVGDVLDAYEFEGETYIRVDSVNYKIFPLQFPDHFRKLRWHDHRTLEQLLSIKYMKIISGESNYYLVGDIVEVTEMCYNNKGLVGGRGSILYKLKDHYFNITQLQPATKEEHDKFWDKNKSK